MIKCYNEKSQTIVWLFKHIGVKYITKYGWDSWIRTNE